MNDHTYTVTFTADERDHLMRLLHNDEREFQHELETVDDSAAVTRRFKERVTMDSSLRFRLFRASRNEVSA